MANELLSSESFLVAEKLETPYTLRGHTIEVVDASKYLGVAITENLSWENHRQLHHKQGQPDAGI